MSAAGFITHALLGGTAESAKGIGNKIREDARLKRQQALEQTRNDNALQQQTHGAALATGRENLQREHESKESGKRREHELTLAELEHKRSKDLVDHTLSSKLQLLREKAEASGKLTGQQEANLDRINGDIDHLHQMERELTSGRTGEFGEIGVVTPDNSGEKLQEIRQRLKAKELAFNRILGNQRGTDTSTAILNEAAKITDPQERQEYLADLKESKFFDEGLARDVQAVWGAKAEPEPTPEPAPEPTTSVQQEPAPESSGMLSEAKAATSTPGQQTATTQPATEPAPPQQEPVETKPKPPRNLDDGAPFMEQRLGPKIEAGAKAVGDAVNRAADRNVQKAAQELSQIARGERDPYQGNIKQFLTNNPEALRALSMEDLQRLQERYGEDFINQFLQ